MTLKARSVGEIPNTYLICRDLGHSWDFHNDSVLWNDRTKEPIMVTRELRCLRCKMGRKDAYYIPSLRKVENSTRYTYPDNYLVSRDATEGERFGRAEARAEHYERGGLLSNADKRKVVSS